MLHNTKLGTSWTTSFKSHKTLFLYNLCYSQWPQRETIRHRCHKSLREISTGSPTCSGFWEAASTLPQWKRYFPIGCEIYLHNMKPSMPLALRLPARTESPGEPTVATTTCKTSRFQAIILHFCLFHINKFLMVSKERRNIVI